MITSKRLYDLKNIPENTDINHIFTKCDKILLKKKKD